MVSRGGAETRREEPEERGSIRAISPSSLAPWPRVKLGNVAIMKRGKYITRNDTRPGEIPVILGGQEPAYYCDEANHTGPCFVISRSGASAGFVSYWQQPIFITDGFLFEANEQSNIRYLYYCLKANQSLLGNMQNGTGIPHVRGEDLKEFEIPLPPLPVQRQIADILSAYDDLIENNRRRIAILEETARRIFESEIVNGNWECEPVDALVEVNPEVPKPTSDGIRYIPMSALSTSGMTVDLSDSEVRTQSTSVRFVNGDVLLAKITPCLENGKTAYVNFLADGEIGCGSSEFIVLRGKRVSSYFTYCLARLEAFRGIAIKSMIGASGRQRVQLSCFSDFQIQVPDDATLRRFDAAVAPIFDQIGVLSKQSAALAAARDMLLPRLMKGNFLTTGEKHAES